MEALAPASIADIWYLNLHRRQLVVAHWFFRFVHERGFRTAIFNLGVLGGINLAVPIGGLLPDIFMHWRSDMALPIAAVIIEFSNYRIALHAIRGAFALALIMIFFRMPESILRITEKD